MARESAILLTGATGLLGSEVLRRLLTNHQALRAFVLVRDGARWGALAARLPHLARRVTPITGDLRREGLGIASDVRARLRREVEAVVHLAADTVFSRPLAEARGVNVNGTMRLLHLASECRSTVRFAYVSTAFVAGRRTGVVLERDNGAESGWVNAYEQSKYEAERLVRRAGLDWVILRSSLVACDGPDGTVSQFNAAHRALRLYHGGLAAMMPGFEDAPLDVVTSEYVSDAIARLALRDDAAGRTIHLCAGTGALPLGEMLDLSYARWAADPAWKRRGIVRPMLADLDTYRLFERVVEDTGDARLRQVTRALSHFVPQLAFPKQFDTAVADALLGHAAPSVRSFWGAMMDHCLQTHWGTRRRAA